MNQLLRQGRSENALKRVYDAYDLAVDLYSGYFQADGKPFVGHVIAVASTLAYLGLPDDLVVAAMVHNIYESGDFGDGEKNVVTPVRQARVRAVVGERVDGLLIRFHELRLSRQLDRVLQEFDALSEDDRLVLLMDLADHYEKVLDGALAYYGDCSWLIDFNARNLPKLVDLADRLGHPRLGRMFTDAMQRQLDWMEKVPDFLRTKDRQKYLKLRIPGSCELKEG
ncbi:MAG: hypothetical protein ABFS45_19840 [Pseudomonadota bacterium]